MNTERPTTADAADGRPGWSIWPTLPMFGGLVVVVVLVMLYVVQEPLQQDVAQNDPAANASPYAAPSPAPAKPDPPKQPAAPPVRPPASLSRPVDPKPPAPKPEPSRSVLETTPPPVETASFIPEVTPPPAPKSTPSPPVSPFDDDGGVSTDDEPEEPTMPKDPVPVAASKPATTGTGIPDKATIAAKFKEIKQIFKAEYAARDPAARADLAQRLAMDAQNTVDDPAIAYVLATEARDQAIQAGDYETFVTVGRLLAERYGIDTHDDDVTAFGKLPVIPGRPSMWYRGLFSEINSRVEESCGRDDFDRAIKYANVAKGIATKAGDAATVQDWTARIKELASTKTQFSSYKAAKEAVLNNPADATASVKWGTYLCLVKGDFAAGMPYLAKGDDAVLAGLAKREANPNRDAAETAAIADEWYAYGEKSRAFRIHAWRHADELYQVARTHLTGLAATKVQKRLEEISSVVTPRAIGGNAVEKLLTAGPWSIQWERPVRSRDPLAGGGENVHEWSHEETITFHEGGHIDSRSFDRFEIGSDFIALYAPEEAGPPSFAGGPPFDRKRDRRTQGRAVLVGGELRLLVFRGDRMDEPRNRGTGTRQKVE